MTSMNDEVLFATLIELADTTNTGFDLVNMTHRLVGACVEVLGVTAAGIMLADQRKSLRVFASSNEETRILELLEIQNNDGPCLEAFNTGIPIDGVDLSRHKDRWPRFAPAAIAAGFNTAFAVPMRLRDQTIGALNLFQAEIEQFSPHKVNVARVLADMAAIGIINHWSLRQQEVLAQQLQGALNTRVIIEQAKGVLAEREAITLGEAFEHLRSTGRSSRRPIAEVAIEIVNGAPTDISWTSDSGTGPPGPPAAPREPAATSEPRVTPASGQGDLAHPAPSADDATDTPAPVEDETSNEVSSMGLSTQLLERLVDPESQTLECVDTAVKLIGTVYLVKPADAIDMLKEASLDLNCTLPDLARQVVADGRLPEGAILRARTEYRPNT